MPVSPLRLIKHPMEFVPKADIKRVPNRTPGIYVLCKYQRPSDSHNVVYVGMSRGEKNGIASRLLSHRRSKGNLLTHSSAFEVWDNIRTEEVEELEGLFRHLHRHDSRANSLNKQRSYKPLDRVRKQSVGEWDRRAIAARER